MNKKTLYGLDARAKVLDGVKKIAAAVKCTLGPMGRNVLISQSMVVDYGVHSLPVRVSKDGYTVTKYFELDDPFEKPGVLLIKECAQKSVDQSGDGTTTTVVLAEAIVEEGIKLIDAGANPMELKKQIDSAVENVVGELKKMAIPIKGDIEKIRQIATVSANNDKSIGNMIAKAFEQIGDEGIIDIEESKGVHTEIKISDGYKFSKGWGTTSSFFITDKEKQVSEYENPYILLYDKKVTHHKQIQRVLEIVHKTGRPIVIICDNATQEGLAFLCMNIHQGRIAGCLIESPSFGDARREEMEDIAMLTGGTYVSDIRAVDVTEIELANLGQARKIRLTKDETVILGGKGDKEELETVINDLRMNLAEAKSEEEKYPTEKRIARLTGGVAVIQVGATTETEMKERMDRFDDSIRATKAAIAEGFVVGGGSAFLRIARNGYHEVDAEQYNAGAKLIYGILKEPLKQICKNAGVDDISILKQLYEKYYDSKPDYGYNAKSDKIEDLVESGIIDPVKVLRCAIQNATSSATMILTSEVLICDNI